MGLLDSFSKMLSGGRLSVESRFELLRTAVAGSMSSFHMARDKKSGEVVGLKLLDPEKTEHFESRFQGLKKPPEGQIAIQMDHPRVVRTLEQGLTTQGQHYLVMEYLSGQGMNALIGSRNKEVFPHRLELLRQAADALRYVHAEGFIHRDICPRNFVVASDYQSLKLIDFGLSVPATAPFMQPGNRTGTPNYMAPEIVRRRATDQRVDVFALGVAAYHFLTYDTPWPGSGTTGKAAMSHDTKPPVPITKYRPDLHPKLADLIMRCMSADPAGRPDSMDEVIRVLSGIDSETAPTAKG